MTLTEAFRAALARGQQRDEKGRPKRRRRTIRRSRWRTRSARPKF